MRRRGTGATSALGFRASWTRSLEALWRAASQLDSPDEKQGAYFSNRSCEVIGAGDGQSPYQAPDGQVLKTNRAKLPIKSGCQGSGSIDLIGGWKR